VVELLALRGVAPRGAARRNVPPAQRQAPRHIRIEHFRRTGILSSVKSFQILLALTLVALWPLATSHCRLEKLPGLEFLACADNAVAEAHPDADCGTDGCASVESGFNKTEDAHLILPGPSWVPSPILTAVLLAVVEPATTTSGLVTDPTPPELPRGWQFSFRAALPPRAPSCVS